MQKLLKKLLIAVFFYQSYAYANFPFSGIVYADSCENPQTIVKWIQDDRRSNIKYVQHRLIVEKKYLEIWKPKYETYYGNNLIKIEYEDYGSEYKNVEISYQFKESGYSEKYRRDYNNGDVIVNFVFVKTRMPVPEMYKCGTSSNASIKFNNDVAERKAQSERAYASHMERTNQLNNKLRSNCRGKPNVNINILENLSRKLGVSPNSIELKRISVRDEIDNYSYCKAIFYHPKGILETDVEFDSRGNINKINNNN